MDPNETLKMLRDLALDIATSDEVHMTDVMTRATLATDMVEYFEALDLWLSKGGYLPLEWDR